MRTSICLLFLGLCAFVYAGHLTPVNKYGQQYRVADKTFLERQKNILRLFHHVLQPNMYEDQVEIARTYKMGDHLDSYSNQHCVREMIQLCKQGCLPRGEIFTIYSHVHRHQAKVLFEVLYHAKDFDTFYKTACWARQYLNEGMFVYVMHAVVLHRHDCQGMVLPPIYEVYPHMFVNKEVINQAYHIKMRHCGSCHGSGNQNKYYILANYSNEVTNPEHHDMSYYNQDVGLNAYYYYYNLDYPFWLGGEEYGLNKDRRGELYYYVHQQLLARYYMERLSNNYGSVQVFDWHHPVKTGFVPSLSYFNGVDMPSRPAYAHLVYNPHNQPFTVTGEDNQFMVQQIEDYERRIRDAIDSGYVFTEDGKRINIYEPHGFDLLGRIIQSNPDSPNTRYYGCLQVIAHQVLGYCTHNMYKYHVHPSAMEHFETALRDPIFYQFYKRITYYFLKYKSHLPSYTHTQLNYPGVKVESMDVDKLITYFDYFDFEITNALQVNANEYKHDNLQVYARQLRLNHKPFTYKIKVQSDKAQDVVVRVFLGPKYDEHGYTIPIKENRVNFVEIDKFKYNVHAGNNVIERNSQQARTIRDRTSSRTLYQKVLAALQGQEEFHLDMSEGHNRYPNRLMLPKGKHGGQVYRMYVYISPCKCTKPTYDNVISAGVGSGTRYLDDLPMGYPLDRQIKDWQSFHVPNSYAQDVVIYHKTEGEINTAHSHY